MCEALLRLTGLRFGVRVEREGQLLVDYHTAKTQDEKTSYVTYRHYLQDAVFLAGIESEDATLLQQLQQALLHPVFPLYLGRRCARLPCRSVWEYARAACRRCCKRNRPCVRDGRAGSCWTPTRWSRARLRSGMCR